MCRLHAGLIGIEPGFWDQRVVDQCRELLQHLDTTIAATHAKAPVRTRPYPLQGIERNVTRPEDLWEEALWRQWSLQDSQSVPGCWHRILRYQVPLKNTHEDRDWGKLDLLGVSVQALPVVIELKCVTSRETPVQMLLQAVRYGIAIRKAWPLLAPQFAEAIRFYGFDVEFCGKLATTPLVCAAPQAYWERHQFADTEWRAIYKVVAALAERGFIATFVSLTNGDHGPAGLPRDIVAEMLPIGFRGERDGSPNVATATRERIWRNPTTSEEVLVELVKNGAKNSRIRFDDGREMKVPNAQLHAP